LGMSDQDLTEQQVVAAEAGVGDSIQAIADRAVKAVEVLDLSEGDVLVVKLGIDDMGDGLPPWIPGPAELEQVSDALTATVPEGVRVLVHHLGINFQIVRGLDTSNPVVVESLPTE